VPLGFASSASASTGRGIGGRQETEYENKIKSISGMLILVEPEHADDSCGCTRALTLALTFSHKNRTDLGFLGESMLH